MERVTLEAAVRDRSGTQAARAARRQGRIPAVVYGKGIEPIPVSVDAKAFATAMRTEAGANVLIDLTIRADGDARTETVMVAEVQRHPLRREVVHVDLHRVTLTEAVRAHVPVLLRGTAHGVAQGGVLEQHLREVVVEALPADVPEHIDVDVSALGLGANIHVRDLPIAAGVEILTPPGEVVLTIATPRGVEEVEAAPPAEPVQPEVIAKGKAEEEEEEK